MARRTTRRIALVPAIPAALLLFALPAPAPRAASPAPKPAAPAAQLSAPLPAPQPALAPARGPAAAPAHGPTELSLAGDWTVWLDPADVGAREGWAADLTAGRRPASAASEPVALAVPGPLEASEATRGYDGVAFYVRDVTLPEEARDALLSLHFEQVNWACRAWLDGADLGAHEGGYDAFDLDLTGRAAPGSHRLVLRVVDPGSAPVDGVTLKTTPHAKESWYENFGGLVGPVTLRIERELRFSGGAVRVDDAASALSVRGAIEAADGRPGVASRAEPPVTLVLAVDGVEQLRLALQPSAGRADFDARVELPGAARWSPEHPELHRVTVSAAGPGGPRELFARDVGLRSVELRDGDLLIDGRRRVLKGVLWQPFFTGTGGVTPPDAELEAEARAIRDTGFNLVRAHVRPAPPAFLDACDRLGLLVLEEPAIGWVDDDPALLPRLQHELDWMVERDGHHASIILWGVLNELSGKAYRHADALVAHLAALDGSRPILEDSGGFFGDGRILPPHASWSGAPGAGMLPMIDRHAYPPYPLALKDRDELLDLGAPGSRPVFVSEFGYGTLPDCAAALAGFDSRGIQSDERVRYRMGASVERRTASSGATWTATNWRAAADRNQADAAEELVEALRANPAVDLLCYTQWRAVSTECSAGVLAPWGEDRPVRASLQHALRPLLAAVFPARLSLAVGEELACTLAVVNDTGAALDGRLLVHGTLQTAPHTAQGDAAGGAPVAGATRTVSGEADVHHFPPGVTRTAVTLPGWPEAGSLSILAALVQADGSTECSSERTVAVIAPPAAPGPVVWRPGDDPSALAAAGAVLLARPEALASELSLDAQLALWRWVQDGGSAVVLLRNPGEAPLGDLLGMSRGTETLAALPLRAPVASAPGNFMGRLFVRRDAPDAAPTPLGRDDALLSPRAMVVGELREGCQPHMLAIGHLGNRLGAPDVSVPFGRGSLHFTGLPLRAAHDAPADATDPAAPGAPRDDDPGPSDPLRQHVLEELLADAARRTAAQRAAAASAPATEPRPALAPLTAAQREALEPRLAAFAQLAAFGDRASPWLSGAAGPQLPASLAVAFEVHDQGMAGLIDGRPDEVVALLDAALDASRWNQGCQAFLALEREVLDGLSRRVAGGTLRDWDAAYDAAELWVSAIAAWFAAIDAEGDAAPAALAAAGGTLNGASVAAGEAALAASRSVVPGLDALRAARDRLAAP